MCVCLFVGLLHTCVIYSLGDSDLAPKRIQYIVDCDVWNYIADRSCIHLYPAWCKCGLKYTFYACSRVPLGLQMSDWNGLFPNEAREFEKRKCALVTNDLDLFLNSRAQNLRGLRLYRMGGGRV